MALDINELTPQAWAPYREKIGFVPDPMILRTGEVFLNGASGTKNVGLDHEPLWDTLSQNIGGLIEFFNFVVTRETIPLIGYEYTFDRRPEHPIENLLAGRVLHVHVSTDVYRKMKRGAVEHLAALDATLFRFRCLFREMDAFHYDWNPTLEWKIDAPSEAVRAKLEALDPDALRGTQYLLGGLIFDAFAQASDTTHYIQPKRSRLYAALTVAPDHAGNFSYQDEDAIFEATEQRLREAQVEAGATIGLPPVLPFLLEDGGEPKTARELLDRALEFRESRRGTDYRQIVRTIEAGGTQAKLAKNMAEKERENAEALLAAYTRPSASVGSVEVTIPGEYFLAPGAKAVGKFPIAVPAWLRVWWNTEVPFGGIRKTLRRMSMASQAYDDLSKRLNSLWMRS